MKVRVITAVIGIIAVLALVWLGGWFLTGAVAIVSLIALWEYGRMLDHISIHIYKKPAALALLVMIFASGFYSIKTFIAAFLLAFCLLLFLILVIKKEEMTNLIYTAFGVVYFGVGFGTLSLLRGSHELLPLAAVNVDPGIFLILFSLVTTWASDSFAYLAGRSFGKHKMAPHISPNKTIEVLSAVPSAAWCWEWFSRSYLNTILSMVSSSPSLLLSWRRWETSLNPMSNGPAISRIPEISCPATAV